MADERVLRICADADNLPFSNQQQQGFENRLASMLAKDMQARVEYAWVAKRRGGTLRLLRERKCDVVLGAPVEMEGFATTQPYYRSAYAMVTTREKASAFTGLDAPALATSHIGLEAIGNDNSNTPVAHALARRQLSANIIGYTAFDTSESQTVPARMLEAIENGEIDVAFLWGPFAGWYAKPFGDHLAINIIANDSQAKDLRFAFSIAAATRPKDIALRDEIDACLAKHTADVSQLLREYGIPTLATSSEH
jgi:quinoprotein dehydrogenase-associated probable ABC transporter substrate-binding protein